MHFPAEERPEMASGRLGEEAARLREIFAAASRHSLVLLNESLASTSATESLYLARDVVRGLQLLGARAVFVTHLHGLAAECDALNAATPGESRVFSLVSLAEEDDGGQVHRTYRIVAAPPAGSSYAREIAEQHGISYAQLAVLLRSRGTDAVP
jgi:DNA mismatch repair ATPase MutS